VVNNVTTLLGNQSITGVASLANMKFVVNGTLLQVFVNDNLIIAVSDTGLTDQGLVGISGNTSTTFGPFSVSRP
jgi:hypothetical protein